MSSAFISTLILLNVDNLAGITMPSRVSTFKSRNSAELNAGALLITEALDTQMNAEALVGFIPKGSQGFWKLVSNNSLRLNVCRVGLKFNI